MRSRPIIRIFCSLFLFVVATRSASATYSIAACDAKTRECGVAVQTNNLAVGASVPYVQAGVGALVSQFETNPHYGPRGLALLAQGLSSDETLKRLLAEDGNFDGQGIEVRQVTVVSIDGRSANFSGDEVLQARWAGVRYGNGYSIQGNGLAGPEVVEAMERAFLHTNGPLADRLLASLIAGDSAGGQKTGRQSAALLVRGPEGWPLDFDLRVDSSSNPVSELKKLFDMQSARQQVVEARLLARKGQFEQAQSLLIQAVARVQWPRMWIQAARVAEEIEEPTLALQYLTMAFSQDPAWAQEEIGQGTYAELGANPLFHRFVGQLQDRAASSAYADATQQKQQNVETLTQTSRLLLEAGHPAEALAILKRIPQTADQTVEILLLRSIAFEVNGDHSEALRNCNLALAAVPGDWRVQRRSAWLSQANANHQR